MKKIFTLVAGLALAGSISVNAETVYLTPSNYDYTPVANYSESELTIDEDGIFVLSDFMYSETPLKFKFDIPEVDKSSNITFTGYLDRTTYGDGDILLMDAEGYYPSCYMYNYKEDGGWSEIIWPYVCEEGYSYVYRYDMTDPENTNEFFGRISLCGSTPEKGWYPWLYIDFFFDIPTPDAVSSVEASATAPVEYFNLAGQRVENPQGGLFIRKQGAKATKVMVK